MNAYLITYKDKKYCTNADNIELAEEKFSTYLELQGKNIDARIDIQVISDVKGQNVEFF